MMKFFLLLVLLGIAAMLPLYVHARDYEGWTVANYNNENGLPQSSVVFVEMDREGYLWMATQAGIVRYDGQRFRLFNSTNSRLLSNRYSMLGKDSLGRIYCIDEYLRIAYYDDRSGFSRPVNTHNMVITTEGGLVDMNRFDTKMLAPFAKGMRYTPGYFNFLHTYHDAGAGKGFMMLCYAFAGYISEGKVHSVNAVNMYKGTHLAIGCIGNTLCYIDQEKDFVLIGADGRRTRQEIPFAIPWGKLEQYQPAVAFFRQEDQLLFYMDGDLYQTGLKDGKLVFHPLISLKDIPDVVCIRYYPERGLLLVGSNTKGLFLFKKQQLASTGKNNWNKPNSFYALAPYGDDQVIATTGILPRGRAVPGTVDALNRYSILRDHNRHYWYSNTFTLLETDEQFRVLRKIPLTKWLRCLQEDETGMVWLSQGNEDFGRVQNDTFRPYRLEGIEGKSIECFIPAGNQTFWLVGRGLCMWIDVKHRRQRIYHQFDHAELRSVYLDRQGNLWLGSYGQGYFLYRKGRFTRMPEDRAQYLKVVSCFLEDRNGFIWMTTNNGLFQCAVDDLYRYADGDKSQVYHHYYGKESGLKTNEFNGGCSPSGLQLSNGRFAFPSMDGVVLFYPDSIRPMLPDARLFMEQVLLDGVPVRKKDLSHIAPDFRRLELSVSSPYLGSQNNLNIEYNLGGLDERWYPLGENGRIVLNRLKYGDYKLRLRKQAGFGRDNYIVTELSLTVLPFFYQTWWFRAACALLAVLLVLLVINIRYRYLIRRQDRLERQVRERTSALVYHNKIMEKLTVTIAHDLKSPLHFLSKVTGHLRHNVQQENFQGISRASGEIQHTADQVYHFVEAFNLWISSFSEGFAVQKKPFALNTLLQELMLFFKEMLEANNNRLQVSCPVGYIVHTDRELLKVILRNLIDNANKHSRGCLISVGVSGQQEGRLTILISDTGAGMSAAVLQRIRDRIAQVATAAGIERNSRLGYQMIIDFAAHLSLVLELQSAPGNGTLVALSQLEYTIDEATAPEVSAEEVVSAG